MGERVYFHPVTRTAERLLGIELEANATSDKPDNDLTDVLSLWSYRDGALLDKLSSSQIPRVKHNAFRLLNRRLPKKAYSFSPGIAGLQIPLGDALPSATRESIKSIQKQVNNTTIEYLRAEKTVGEIGANIERQIFGHALEILGALRSVDEKDLIPDGCEPTCLILIGAAHENPMQHSPIIFQNDRLVRVKHYTNSPEQQVAFELRKETGFVLCEDEWCGIVFFAARHVLALIGNNIVSDDLELRREHGEKHIVNISYMTRFLPEFSTSVLRSGQSSRIIEKLARALCAAKFFDDKPWLGLDAKQSNLSEGRNARIESGY